MVDLTIFSTILNGIIKLIASARNLFPENIYGIIAGVIAFVVSYYWLKQFIVGGLWAKISTILNLILMALLIFILLTKVG